MNQLVMAPLRFLPPTWNLTGGSWNAIFLVKGRPVRFNWWDGWEVVEHWAEAWLTHLLTITFVCSSVW